MADNELGATLARLAETINARRRADPKTSYTASLLSAGRARCAKKFGEEAVETAIAGATGGRDELAQEAADALYHLLVLLVANDVTLSDVAAALEAREGTSGHDEKAARD